MGWPIVLPDDNRMRPAGPDDECMYCRQKTGQPHRNKCVSVLRRVRMRYEFEIEIAVPAFWTTHDIEFHRNDSSWCAGNAVDDIEKCRNQRENNGGCLCGTFKATFISDVEGEPFAWEDEKRTT